MIQKAFKYRIYPNNNQRTLIEQHFGCSRFIYNWGLKQKIEAYQKEKKTENYISLSYKLPKLKEEFIWLKNVYAQSLQNSLKNIDNAFRHFFKEKKGFPKFKSKKSNHRSYSIPQGSKVDFESGKIQIPKIGLVTAKLSRDFQGKIKTVTISRTPSFKYYASVLVELNQDIPTKPKIKESTSLGIDVGLTNYATLSTGEKVSNPRNYRKLEKQIKQANKSLSRKQIGGKNRNKQRIRLSKIHEKITNRRRDFLHKLTYQLTHENQVDTLIVEDLSIANILKNHRLAKSVSDAAWSEFFGMLKYKCEWYGKNLITIGRFDPSSKLCSCGVINKSVSLSDRTWSCSSCGQTHDRDILAAQNIKRFGLLKQNKRTVGATGIAHCPVEV